MTEVVAPVPAVKKSLFKSKTFYMNLVMALSPLFPAVQAWVVENTAAFGMIWGALGIILRMVTKEKIVLVD